MVVVSKFRRILYAVCVISGVCLICVLYDKLNDFLWKKVRVIQALNVLHVPYGVEISEHSPSRLKNTSLKGLINCHTWALACEVSLKRFIENPLYPISPNTQTLVDSLSLKWSEQNSKDVNTLGRRMFGYLLAPYSGIYVFSLTTNCNVEFLLSKDDQVNNARRILESDVQNNNKSHLFQFYSLEIYLKKNHYYYIEVLLTQQPNGAFLLKWKIPTGQKFEAITTDYIFTFMPNNLVFKDFMELVPLHSQRQSFIYRHPRHSILQNTEQLLSVDKYLEWGNVKEALPLCQYQPGFVGKTVMHRYHAVEDFVNPSYVYPQVAHSNISDGKWIPWFPLNEKEALDIVDLFTNHLETAYPRQYKLRKILNIEKKPDWHESNPVFYQGTLKNGDRFFLELLLWDEKSGDEKVLSEYVYQPTKNSSLCYPEGMQWNKKAPVYLLISARKQASWLWYFIHNVGRIYKETKDENLHVVVYDYDSTDINIEKEFRRSSFENFVILKNPDSMYSRTFSLNRAAEAVKDPHAIIFTIDLHLEIPPTFANNVRKHCIYDKMVYTPILTRLVCGASPSYPSGSWDPWGYGMFGAYKANWDKFKGFDEVQFRTKWGGEDWDLVDRAYRSGLEFERIKMADFYHYDHSKVGLWT